MNKGKIIYFQKLHIYALKIYQLLCIVIVVKVIPLEIIVRIPNQIDFLTEIMMTSQLIFHLMREKILRCSQCTPMFIENLGKISSKLI